jgi:integrase
MVSLMVALKRSKGGAFTARKVIPADVREEYVRLYGVAWEEKLRLPPETPMHEAKARCGEWLAEIETRIGKLRAAKSGQGQPLTRQNAYALAGRWYSWFVALNEKDLRTPKHWRSLGDNLIWDVIYPHAPDEYHAASKEDPSWDWKLHPEVRAEIRPVISEEARTASFLLEQGIALTPDANNLFVDAVADNLLDAFTRLEAMARGNYTSDELLNSFPQYVDNSKPAQRLGVWSLFQAWAEALKPASSTVDRWSAVFRAADKQFPDAVDIPLSDAKVWMNGLSNEARSAHTVATVWRTALKTVFAWGLNEGLVRSNPFKDIRVNVPRKTTERETKAFTPEEVKVILAAALASDDTQSFDERARRWVPWICAYSGARAGEITQLRGSDVERRGNDYFAKLSPSAGKIKTRKARTVPLHEHVIAQGFISFVERSGTGPLFYGPPKTSAEAKPKPRQSPAERARGRLGQWVRSLGINDPELSPTHAWRHTFKAQAARSGIDERYSDAITGHAPASVGRSYTTPTAEDRAGAMRKFPRYELPADEDVNDALTGHGGGNAVARGYG